MKYSIIMPVYGVEKYLDQCVQSVLAQNFEDFELILVDDKSPDNCPAMCDAWAEKDSRIRVIHKAQNEGLGFARNTGLADARGEYVLFLDSDDYIAPTLLAECNAAIGEDTDFLVFGLEYVYQDKNDNVTLVEQAVPECFVADTPEKRAQLFAMLNHCRAFPFAWNKIYKRAFLEAAGTLFEKTKLIEDFLFNIALFGKANRIDALDRALYCYRKPAHETLVSKYAPEFFDLCKRKYNLEKEFLTQCGVSDPAYADLIHQSYVKHFVSAVIKNHSKAAGFTVAQQIRRIQEMMEDPLTEEVIVSYVPQDRKLGLIVDAIRAKRGGLVLTYCVGIDFVQRNMRLLYRKLLKKVN